MLSVLQTAYRVRFTRSGRLLPWLGPALRGLVARHFKDRVCLFPPAERERRWRYCTGCLHLHDCPYGSTFEAEAPRDTPGFRGQDQATRPVVLALPFPMPPMVQAGDTTTLTLTLLGASAISHARPLVEAITDAGRRFGFGPERTTFDLEEPVTVQGPTPLELPLQPGPAGDVVTELRVELTGPLFLRLTDNRGRKSPVGKPEFADLFRACLRVLGRLAAVYDAPLPADFAGLKAVAMGVPLRCSNYVAFRQDHRSNRSGSRVFQGAMGNGVYGPVPRVLLPWLEWGGRLHVGHERVAGAGSWRVTF